MSKNNENNVILSEKNIPPPLSITEQIFFNEDLFNKIEKTAKLMASGKCTVPAHLRSNASDCFAIIVQSLQWKMNYYSVAQKTHLINGVLGYEAQLVNAVINNNAPTKDRLHDEYFGDWTKVIGKFKWQQSSKGTKYQVPGWTPEDEQGLGIKVWATIKGEESPRVLELLLSQATVRNSTLWASDPKQQLYYLAVKRWSRKYCPDVVMGVYSMDEIENSNQGIKNVTPTKKSENRTQEAIEALSSNVSNKPATIKKEPIPNQLPKEPKKINGTDQRLIFDALNISNKTEGDLKTYMFNEFQIKRTSELDENQFKIVQKWLEMNTTDNDGLNLL